MARARGGASVSGSAVSQTSVMRTRPAKRSARARASSVPAAPPPTSATRAPSASAPSSRASVTRKSPIGFTPIPPPGGIAGTPPISIESQSKRIAGRPRTAIWRAARSIAVASAITKRAPATAASGPRSIYAASGAQSPRISAGSRPE